MLAPKNCFVGKPSSEFYSKLFSYIDFGELGNSFLSSCQAKREPTVDDIALALIDNPGRFYDLAGAAHGYYIAYCDIVEVLTDSFTDICENCEILQASTKKFHQRYC